MSGGGGGGGGGGVGGAVSPAVSSVGAARPATRPCPLPAVVFVQSRRRPVLLASRRMTSAGTRSDSSGTPEQGPAPCRFIHLVSPRRPEKVPRARWTGPDCSGPPGLAAVYRFNRSRRRTSPLIKEC